MGAESVTVQDANHVVNSEIVTPHVNPLIVQGANHVVNSEIITLWKNPLIIQDVYHSIVGDILTLTYVAQPTVQDANHTHKNYAPYITTGGGLHDNTIWYDYGGDDYLKCRHLAGVLTGTYTSQVYDRGSSTEYLIYVLASVVVIGAGTTWDDQVPSPVTWNQVNASTRTWNEIFNLDEGPSVSIRVYYGDTNPPTSYVDKMEILSAIVTGQYYQVEITITDPSPEINAIVENYELKFCT